MAILLYCIAERAASISDSITGVSHSRVFRRGFADVEAFISEDADSGVWLKAELRTAALQFHRVQSEIFRSATILPVRFPTIFQDEEEFLRHLHERSAEYAELLNRFAGMAQMEVRIQIMNSQGSKGSGTEYLLRRQTGMRTAEETRQRLKTLLSSIATDWRDSRFKDGFRAFVLVERVQIENLRNALRNASLPEGIAVRVSGPWPVSEFLPRA